MSFADRYSFNKKLAEDGTWISKGGGLDIKVRRLNSKAARKVVTDENKKHANLTKGGRQLPPDIADMVNRRVAAYGLLMDWRDTPKGENNPDGLEGAPRDEAGNVIQYTPEVGLEFFVNYPDFMEDVIEDSSSIEHFRDEQREEIAGN